jgi:hypothetical protein
MCEVIVHIGPSNLISGKINIQHTDINTVSESTNIANTEKSAYAKYQSYKGIVIS